MVELNEERGIEEAEMKCLEDNNSTTSQEEWMGRKRYRIQRSFIRS